MTHVTGICGNYDYDMTNDLTTAAGIDVSLAEGAYMIIGNSYVVDDVENQNSS